MTGQTPTKLEKIHVIHRDYNPLTSFPSQKPRHPSRAIINPLQPNPLLHPRRKRTRPQQRPHLLHTRPRHRPGHKPADPFPTRRRRETAPVGPKRAEPIHAIQRQPDIHRHIRHNTRCIFIAGRKGHERGELCQKGGRSSVRIDSDGEDGDLVTFVVDVDEMHFRPAAVAIDGVFGGRVDMPALEIGGLVVESQLGQRGVIVFRVFEVERRAVTPVGPITHDGAVVICEGWTAVPRREAAGEGESDGGLLGAGLTSGVFGADGAPVVGSVVGPVGVDVGRVGGADVCAFLDEGARGQVASLVSGVICTAEDGPRCEGGS